MKLNQTSFKFKSWKYNLYEIFGIKLFFKQMLIKKISSIFNSKKMLNSWINNSWLINSWSYSIMRYILKMF